MTHKQTGSLLFFRNEARLIMFQLQAFDFLFQRSVPLKQIKVHTETRTRLKYRPLFQHDLVCGKKTVPTTPQIPIWDLILKPSYTQRGQVQQVPVFNFFNSKTFTGSSIPPTKSKILYLAWSPAKTTERQGKFVAKETTLPWTPSQAFAASPSLLVIRGQPPKADGCFCVCFLVVVPKNNVIKWRVASLKAWYSKENASIIR